MNTDFIDLIYQNEAVEGVAIFSSTGILIENQLSINESSALLIAKTITDISNSLSSVKRPLQGFFIKSDTITIQICLVNNIMVLLEVNNESSANETDHKLRSILGDISIPEVPNLIDIDDTPVEEIPIQEEQAAETVQTTEALPAEGDIKWSEYKAKLTSILKRVAPDNIVENMIKSSLEEGASYGENTFLSKEQAIEIGQKVILKIPNKARRKLIEKEFSLYTNTL